MIFEDQKYFFILMRRISESNIWNWMKKSERLCVGNYISLHPLGNDETWQRCNPLDRRSMANHPYKTNRSLFAYSYSHLFILYPWVFQTTETRDATHHHYLRYHHRVFLGWAHTATASRSRLISQTRGSLNTFPHLLLLLFIYLFIYLFISFLMIFRFMFFLLFMSLFFRYTSCIGT